jgi:hypothetical protein
MHLLEVWVSGERVEAVYQPSLPRSICSAQLAKRLFGPLLFSVSLVVTFHYRDSGGPLTVSVDVIVKHQQSVADLVLGYDFVFICSQHISNHAIPFLGGTSTTVPLCPVVSMTNSDSLSLRSTQSAVNQLPYQTSHYKKRGKGKC